MPSTLDKPEEDADWSQWNQKLREARPELPEPALARIEATVQREAARIAAQPPTRNRWRWILAALALAAIAVAIPVSIRLASREAQRVISTNVMPGLMIRDVYGLEGPVGPRLRAPENPILNLDGGEQSNHGQASNSMPEPAKSDAGAGVQERSAQNHPATLPPILRGAERLVGANPDGWHALGLFEMQRAAGISDPPPATKVQGPREEDYWPDVCWRKLPMLAGHVEEFRNLFTHHASRMGGWLLPFQLSLDLYTPTRIARRDLQPWAPGYFPAYLGNKARFDLLVELGVPPAQAGLDVLTSRSYEPMSQLAALDHWDGASPYANNLREGYLAASHDFAERQFALRLLGRNQEADALREKARSLRYLHDPADLAVLLARLGPSEAWEKLVKPLMNDEVRFIELSPKFEEIGPRPPPVAVVEAQNKSVQEGVTTYTNSVTVTAGPLRIDCDKLTVFRAAGHGALLSGGGKIQIHGVLGLFAATADEVTLNTETGEMKLAGGVRLEGWEAVKNGKSCTITRTGEVKEMAY